MLRLIYAKEFPPFGELKVKFPKVVGKPENMAEVHLFTGTNGTGKTRILSLLAAIFGHKEPLASRWPGEHGIRFSNDITHESLNPNNWSGHLSTNGGRGGDSALIEQVAKIPAFAYGGGAYISDAAVVPLAEMSKPRRDACLSFSRAPEASQIVLQAITNLKMQAAMEVEEGAASSPEVNTGRSSRIIRAIETAVTEITGLPFAFRIRAQPKISINVRWGRSETLPFSSIPDGLRQVIGWLVHAVVMTDAWLGGQGTPMESNAVFLLDEIEGHLHPAWQRKILPAFQKMFPKSQIFVSTHSPFVIASLNSGWIHRITMDATGAVKIHPPQEASVGDSYVTVVEDIMGVREWYDPETEKLLGSFREMRDAAYKRSVTLEEVKELGAKIASRSVELQFLIMREIAQLERQLKA